jgi:hypothetical protein
MKKLLSKNSLIVLFLFSNLALGAYILVDKHGAKFWGGGQPQPKKIIAKKRAAPIPAASFKDSGELQACYEALLARDPSVQEGTVHVNMTIDTQGQIDFLKMVHSDLDDSGFTDCVLENIREQKVQATAERMGVVISHKFNFRKRDIGSLEFGN